MKKSFEETTRGYPDPDIPEGRGCAIMFLIFAVIVIVATIIKLWI